MQSKRLKIVIDGLLLIDKPLGLSSNQVLSKIKFLFSPKKVGHTGTLDPMATGLLPICLGEATKFSSYLLNADKTYEGLIRLGYKSSTGDKEGQIIRQDFGKMPSMNLVKKILNNFIGPIEQIPPMYSAIKHKGKPLYSYAREGINIPRAKRKIIIYEIKLLAYQGDELRIKIKCSKGTYIRTLAEDIGDQLNTGAYLLELNRTDIGSLSIKSALKVEQIEKNKEQERINLLLPIDELVSEFDKLILNPDDTASIKDGKIIEQGIKDGFYRLYDDKNMFFGLGEIDKIGNLKAKRLISLKN
jgi:tRNA pseudouridine55 synthase|tara:strand:+ start:1037 stop:1939 length:903 start_codon:yes stop_codon:yes gene_type:complete